MEIEKCKMFGVRAGWCTQGVMFCQPGPRNPPVAVEYQPLLLSFCIFQFPLIINHFFRLDFSLPNAA